MLERLRRAEAQLAQPKRFRMFGEYGELHLPPLEHRLWSPLISFYIAEQGSEATVDRSLLYGRFAPRVDAGTVVWSSYLFLMF